MGVAAHLYLDWRRGGELDGIDKIPKALWIGVQRAFVFSELLSHSLYLWFLVVDEASLAHYFRLVKHKGKQSVCACNDSHS